MHHFHAHDFGIQVAHRGSMLALGNIRQFLGPSRRLDRGPQSISNLDFQDVQSKDSSGYHQSKREWINI
jgi:hypothetical protein